MHDKSRLLIVDDDKQGRETLEMLLSSENCQIYLATSGQQALTQASELTPIANLLKFPLFC